MPIPQLSKKSKAAEYVRSATELRKKRAEKRHAKDDGDVTPGKGGRFSKIKRGLRTAFSRKHIVKTLAAIAIGVVGLGMISVAIAYAWVSKDLADIEDVSNRAVNESTKIYARDGQTLLYELGDNKRTDVTLDKIDKKIQQATIALEDRDFYKHSGFKLTSIIRAFLANVTGGLIKGQGGASTLTQQFIKNAILTNEHSYTRKLKEIILSVRLEGKYTKDEILGMYLNEVYYGANYQGVESASEEYFNKPASDVSLAEAATLAALPQDPVKLPRDPERLKNRRDYAIDEMVSLGYASQADADAAKLEPVNILEHVTHIKAPHLVFMVSSYLEEKYGQNTVRKGGLKVVTTLDWDKQQKAEQAISDGMVKVESYGGDNAALVTMDAHTGQILALVGSRDFFDDEHDGQFNVATTNNRQPGSSFKPIVYLTAFTKGYIPETKIYDVETVFPNSNNGGPWSPHNFAGINHVNGPVTMRYALDQSLNIPAVKAMYLAGIDNVINTANSLGYSAVTDHSLAVALGADGVSLVEHTAAYATFAREGEYHAPATVLSVTDKNGNTLEEWKDDPHQVVDAKAARMLNSVLSDAGARGSTFAKLNLSDRPTAAKTGTSSDFRDAWTMGYTPSIVTGVWTGRNDFQPMKSMADGVVIAAPIWNAYMASILTGTPVETFKAAEYKAANDALAGNLDKTVTKSVDSTTGAIIPDECIASYPTQYVAQKDFKETHTILYYIDRNNPTGPAPSDPNTDPMYASWEKGVQDWLKSSGKSNEYLTDDTPKADCHARDADQQPSVNITSLDNNASYAKADFSISANATPGNGRTITAASYIIDVITVDSASGLSITSKNSITSVYKPKTLTEGKHSVTVRVTDDKGNIAEDTLNFTYLGK